MGQFEGCAKALPEDEPSVLQTDGKFIVFLIFDPLGLIKVHTLRSSMNLGANPLFI